MKPSGLFFRALGQAADCAWSSGCADGIGPWVASFGQAHGAGDEWADWDRHGRYIGRVRVQRQGAQARLIDAWLPRGGLRPWAGMLATGLQGLGVERLHIQRHGRSRVLPLARLSSVAVAEPDRVTPLHPVLAGMAAAEARDAVEQGQALALLAADPRHAATPLVEAVRRIKRARGSGQMRLWAGADGEPRGLLIWARPSASLLAAFRERSEQRFHAAEWNAGGEPVVLELCAAGPASAREVALAATALLEADEPRLHVRLDDAAGRGSLLSVERAELAAFTDWLAQALVAPCC